jgi:hypothetical protein
LKKMVKRFHSIFEARIQKGLQNNKPSNMNNVLDNTGAQIWDAISQGRINFVPRRLTLVGFQYGTLLLLNFQTPILFRCFLDFWKISKSVFIRCKITTWPLKKIYVRPLVY